MQTESVQAGGSGEGEAEGEPPLEISLGPARAREPVSCQVPSRRREMYAARVGAPDHHQFRVFLAVAAWQAMLTHLGQDTEYEVSGLLVGALCTSGAESFVDITGALPATEAASSQHHVTINHDAWQSLLEAKDARDPAERIVGWYHSHPALGIFLSEQDKFVHTHFFAEPWQVAVVIDPIAQRWGLFGWEEAALGTRGGFHLYGPREERSSIEKYASVASKTIVHRRKG